MKWLAVVALATVATALPEMFMGRRNGGFTRNQHREVDPSILANANYGRANVTQKLDHFDTSNTKTWNQRYFFNHDYVKKDSNVNILYLAGEQWDSEDVVLGEINSYVYYAKQLNADLFNLEHRFYGRSHPTEDTSTENLKFLSSRQAIEDIAEFIRQKNEEKGGNQKWIVIGGSYAGALSAWARLMHPELISGSVASSGPVLAQMDFYGYLQTVDENFKKHGGLCYDQLGAGINSAEKLLQSAEGRKQLSDIFEITPPLSSYDVLSPLDIDNFFSYLTYPFEISSQYNDPPIDTLCKKFTAKGPNYDPLKAFKLLIEGKMNVNFTESVQEIGNTDFKYEDSTRLWFYQTCTEFGYFQSTNKGSNIFGQTQSSNPEIEYCEELFGITADQIQKNIDATNEYYGERDYYAGTNVLFSHGTQDPWSFLTKKSDPKHWSVVIVEVEGGSHCADIGESCFHPAVRCTDNMRQIQTLTLENMKRWINPVFPVPDRVDISDNVGKRPQFFDPNVSPSLQINVNSPDSDKLRARRSTEVRKSSKKIDFKKWNKFTGKGQHVLLPPPVFESVIQQSDSADQGQDWIEQTWDHFNPNEERTFKQKWYYNYKFGSANGPNFLMIGGEGPESGSWTRNENVAWMTYAKAVGANVFLLEHRYYGESKLGTNDLQYLTSAQMLYDVATFIRTQQVQQNRTGPWITFGGSYPGALAAWSREWFPELILGAVGSSGPVLAKADFYEYLEVVEDVIKRQSQKCYDRTTEAFETLHKLSLDPDGRATIQDKFILYPKWTSDPKDTIDPFDMNEVFGALYGMYQGTVQYNDVDWSDVKDLCSHFEDDNLSSLDALSALRMEMYGDDSILSSYDMDVQYLIDMKKFVDGHDKTYSDNDLSSILWTWQTCNEFGYYQSTDYGKGIFGTPVPINFDVVMCEKVFGVGMDHVENGVSRTNYQYGGRSRYNTTNVVLPNGDADPWHALGIVEQGNLDKSVVPLLIKGTSHCADMYGADPSDPPELTQARKTVLENIQKWLSMPTSQTTTTVSPTTSPSSSASFLLPFILAIFFSCL